MIEDGPTSRSGRPRFQTLATLNVEDALATVRRHAVLIASLGLLGGVAAYGTSFLIPASYVADAQIFVDPRSIQALDTQTTQPDANAEVLFVESQAQIITSESVLSRVVAADKLAADPEFNRAAIQGGDPGLGARLAERLGLRTADPAPVPELAERTALAALADRVTVRRPERTFVLDIAVRARTADKAAQLANAVAQAYFDEQSDAHTQMARRANKSLTDRLDELRGRVRNSEERADVFRRDHGLVGTRTQLVSEQQLTDANTQLAQARSRVIAAQSRIDEIRQIGAKANQPGASPEALVSPTITLLRGQQAEAKRRLDKALGQLGPRHPEVRDARAEVEGLDRAVTAELARIAQAARVELQRATATEAAQRKVVDDLSGQATSASSAFTQLGEIEREVDVNKNLLNTFLNRARETSELEQMNTNTARLISTAQPPSSRTFPPRGSVFAMLGLFAGLALGSGIALLRVRRSPLDRLAPMIDEADMVEEIEVPRTAAAQATLLRSARRMADRSA